MLKLFKWCFCDVFLFYTVRYVRYGSCETLNLVVVSVVFALFLNKQTKRTCSGKTEC